MKTTMITLAALIGTVGCLAGEAEVAPRTASAEPSTAQAEENTATAEQPLQAPAATTSADQSCEAFVSCAVPLNLVHWKS